MKSNQSSYPASDLVGCADAPTIHHGSVSQQDTDSLGGGRRTKINKSRLIERRLLVENEKDSQLLEALGKLKQKYPKVLPSTILPLWIVRLFHYWAHSYGANYYFSFWDWAITLPGIAWERGGLLYWLTNLVAANQSLKSGVAFQLASLLANAKSAEAGPVAQPSDAGRLDTFCKRYDREYPFGLSLKVPQIHTRIVYCPSHPATARALISRKTSLWHDLPDFFAEADQFKTLVAMWHDCPQTGRPTRPFFEEVIVRAAKPAAKSEAPSAVEVDKPLEPFIDQQKFDALTKETAEVAALLGGVLSDSIVGRKSANPTP